VSPRRANIPSLPQSVLVNGHTHSRRHHLASRKDARRQGRAAQKQRKAEYFSHTPNLKKRPAGKDHTESPQRKKPRQNKPESAPGMKDSVMSRPNLRRKDEKLVPIDFTHKTISKFSQKPSKTSTLLKRSKKSSTPKISVPREDPEDAYIAYLEGQLGLSNNHGKKMAEEDDGLDGMSWIYCLFLSISDVFTAWQTSWIGLTLSWYRRPRWALLFYHTDQAYLIKSPLKSSGLTSGGDESTSEEYLEESQNENYDSEEEWNGITQYEPAPTSDQELENEVEIPIFQAARPSGMLHITERIATFADAFAGTYLPPHLRKAQDSIPQAIQKLTRQLKGLLNRYVYSLKYLPWKVTYVSQDEWTEHWIYCWWLRKNLQGTLSEWCQILPAHPGSCFNHFFIQMLHQH